MDFLISISPLIIWLAIIVAIVWLALKVINHSKPKTDLERRVETLEEEIRNLRNNK